MNKIRTIIIDDEPLAREGIRTLLAGEAEFKVVGECENGAQAIEAIEKSRPDLIFLDVQMPEVDGFEILMAIEQERLPLVIFVTAYDRYAVRAFDVHAIDYLLKPIDRKRFKDAAKRVISRMAASRMGEIGKNLAGLLDDVQSRRRDSDRLVIKSGGTIQFLPTEEIDWIGAAGNYLKIHAGSEVHLMRETMAGMENRLAPERFVRIHRSTIVNLKRVKKLEPGFAGDYVVFLSSGQELMLTRRYRPNLEKRFGDFS